MVGGRPRPCYRGRALLVSLSPQPPAGHGCDLGKVRGTLSRAPPQTAHGGREMPKVTRVSGGRGEVRPCLLLGTTLGTGPQMPLLLGDPRPPHGSQAPGHASATPSGPCSAPSGKREDNRPVSSDPACPWNLGFPRPWGWQWCWPHPALRVTWHGGQESKCPQARGSGVWRSSPLTLPGPPAPSLGARASRVRCSRTLAVTSVLFCHHTAMWGGSCCTCVLDGETEAGARMPVPLVPAR